MSEIINVKNLGFYFGEEEVLREIQFTFEKGKIYAIVGPNGSGKTTLLSLLARHLTLQEGEIYLYEKDMASFKLNSLAKEMSVVTQNNTINYDFKVQDIILMGRAPYIKRFDQPSKVDLEKVNEALEFTETLHLKDKLITQLSGGEFQRVILARAIAQDTKIMLLDEPVTALDIHHQKNIMELIRGLAQKKGMTIIHVIHDLNLALNYSDESMMLKDGCIFSKGSVKEVLIPANIKAVYGVNVTLIEHPIDRDKNVIIF